MAAKKKTAKKSAPKKKGKQKVSSAKSAPPIKGGAGSQLATKLRTKYGNKITVIKDEEEALAQITEYIPSGIDVLDNYVIGRGGGPVSRIAEIIGEEACGKTALLYRWLGCTQRVGGVAALADAEFSFDSDRARVHGIDTSELIMEQPTVLEEALEMVKDTVGYHNPKHGPLLIGLDSIASMNTKKGIGMAVGDMPVGEAARILSDELRDLPPLLRAHRAYFVCINQIRHKIGVSFGSNITTPGGKSLAFYASLRLQFFGGKAIKDKHGDHIGKVVTLMAIKNRLAPPFRKARIRFDYASGYNNLWTTVEHAKSRKLVKPRRGGDRQSNTAYIEALEALDWDINPIGPLGLEGGLDDAEVADDDDDD